MNKKTCSCYKIIVSYDGSSYHGWQVQKDKKSVASVLQHRFERTFFQTISLVGASRTDAGVHALGQVASFATDLPITTQKMKRVWNNALPSNIVIRSLAKVKKTFHPQRRVKQKTYWYHIFIKRPLPFFERYGFFCKRSLDVSIFKKSLEVFVGTHDFRSFCTGYDCGPNTVRTIDGIRVTFLKKYSAYRVTIKGKSFLRYMIRRIVGASLEIACKKNGSIDELKKALKECNPEQPFTTAAAKGLLLYHIEYEGGNNE